jgi:hypothetical protein
MMTIMDILADESMFTIIVHARKCEKENFTTRSYAFCNIFVSRLSVKFGILSLGSEKSTAVQDL